MQKWAVPLSVGFDLIVVFGLYFSLYYDYRKPYNIHRRKGCFNEPNDMDTFNYTIGTLFSGGLDGFAVGAQELGIQVVYNCENNKWRRAQLKKSFPKC